jgi:hypothetical protein
VAAPETNNWNVRNAPSHFGSVDAPGAANASWNQGSYQQIAQRPPYIPGPATQSNNQNQQVVTHVSPSPNVGRTQLDFPNSQESNKSQSEFRSHENPQESLDDEEEEEEEGVDGDDRLVPYIQYYTACFS